MSLISRVGSYRAEAKACTAEKVFLEEYVLTFTDKRSIVFGSTEEVFYGVYTVCDEVVGVFNVVLSVVACESSL